MKIKSAGSRISESMGSRHEVRITLSIFVDYK